MPNPAADVWYTFTASSNIIDVSITGLNNPNMALYEGNSCNTIIGRGCATGSFGYLTATFQALRAGRRYYMMVAGGDAADTGRFTLNITSRNDCDPCLIQSALTVNPLPANTVYQPGTTVRFCFTVTQWAPTAVNWIHAIIPTFGPGWNTSSLVPYPPPTCDGHGYWGWYNSVTSYQTGITIGPGFFYESDLGCPFFCNPNDPGDNYGDNCTGAVNFVYCWDITTASCPPARHADNLNVSINTYGDGESGSWTSFACAADPLIDFFATLSCCPQPVISYKNVRCRGAGDGWIIAQAQGAAPFIYKWLDASGSIIRTVTKSSPDTLSGLSAGTLTVEITDTLQCFTSTVITISEPPALTASIVTSDITCAGQNNGSITVNLSGGIPPYQYSLDGTNFQNSSSFAGLGPASYNITARDDSGCIITPAAVISEPAPLAIMLDSIFHPACFAGDNGAVYTTVAGGTPPYAYDWSNGATSDDISGLSAGNYGLTITDANGCLASGTYSVTAAGGFTIALIAASASCHGGADGSVNLTLTGGAPPFSYSWSNGASTEDMSGLSAGTYTVVISDANQCADTAIAVINEPPPIALNATLSNLLCSGDNSGAIDLTVSGGVPPFTFLWSNNELTEDISGLPARNFSVIATDANMCTAAASFVLSEPAALTLTATKTDVRCAAGNDGMINLTIAGGTLPYQITWSNFAQTEDISGLTAATYDVVVIDLNGCTAQASVTISEPFPLVVSGMTADVRCHGGNTGAVDITAVGGVPPYAYQWSNMLATEDLSAVTAGNYTVTVMDANQCTAASAFTVSEPSLLLLTGAATDATCFGSNDGIIQLAASGGTLPYQYSLDGIQFQPVPAFDNVLPGSYQPVVRDGNNCTASTVMVISAPLPIITSVITDSVSCYGGNDGTAIVTATGMNGPFTYRWSNNAFTNIANNLAAGTYYVTVTDANNCTRQVAVTVDEPPQMILSATVTHVLCHGGSNGSIVLNVSGGIPGYTFRWSNSQTSQNISALTAGGYSVTVTDNNNCTAAGGQYVVSEPMPLSLTVSVVPVLCHGGSNGIALVSATGGTPAYRYQWDAAAGNLTTSSAANLSAGTYDVVVTDGNNCTATITATVTEPPPLHVAIDTFTHPRCNGEQTGFASAAASGGTPPISYRWSSIPPAITSMMTGVGAGTYVVTVTDGNGCRDSASVSLREPPPVTVVILPAADTISIGDSIQLHAVHSPAIPVQSYLWEPDDVIAWCVNPCSAPVVFPSVSTIFRVHLTDLNGCRASAQAFIDVEYVNNVYIPNVFTPNGDGVNDVFEIFYTPSLAAINYMVFNRWGERLFQTNVIGEFWDGTFFGKAQNPGIYVYWLDAGFLNGERKQYKGSFTLVR